MLKSILALGVLQYKLIKSFTVLFYNSAKIFIFKIFSRTVFSRFKAQPCLNAGSTRQSLQQLTINAVGVNSGFWRLLVVRRLFELILGSLTIHYCIIHVDVKYINITMRRY